MIEAPPASRRTRTGDAIRKAGRRLFATRAVESVSIDMVVAEAKVSKGSFYNHFIDREALVQAVVNEIREWLNARVAAVNAGELDPARRVARAVSVFLRYAVDEPEGAAALARIHGRQLSLADRANKPLVDDMRDGLASGRFNIPTLEAGVMLVIGVVQVGLVRVVEEPELALAVSHAQQLCLMLLRGLGVETAEAGRLATQAAEEIVRDGNRHFGLHVHDG